MYTIYNASVKRQVDDITFERKTEVEGDIVPGSLGNLCIDVRDSKVTIQTVRRLVSNFQRNVQRCKRV